MAIPGMLALADGTILRGDAVGATGVSVGELVFNTAMTGYQEILTDPSYHRQIVTFTAAHVGNVGVTAQDEEADRPQVAGMVARDVPRRHSSWRATGALGDYLVRHGVVAIHGVDTRRLTRHLRDGGAQSACIAAGPDLDAADLVARARAAEGLDGADLARVVTRAEAGAWERGSVRWLTDGGDDPTPTGDPLFHVVAYDFGVKRNILRMLVDHGCRVTVVPAETDADAVTALRPDGVLLSNGPGDPAPLAYAQAAIRRYVAGGLPLFGICLGHQLLCLALGARSIKMKFGHRGANHPVLDHDTGAVAITSQNHGFAIDADSLPPSLRVTHTSLFDGTLQGVAHTDAPAFSFQGHPEASPGPRESGALFDRFIAAMRAAQRGTG